MSKAAVGNLLVRANAFAPFRLLNRGKLPVLMYHRFSEGEEIGKTSRGTFERHLRYLTRHYSVISLSEAVSRLRDGRVLPERSAVITVDDGYSDFFEIAFPVLEKFQVPAVIYLVSGFTSAECWIWTDKARYILLATPLDRLEFRIGERSFSSELGDSASRLRLAGSLNSELKKLADTEKNVYLEDLANGMKVDLPRTPPGQYSALTWDQARELASGGIEIGSHTHTHPILTNVDAERLQDEIERSRTTIQNELQRELVHFCYPNGNVARRERDAAEAAGYASAVTTEIRLCENGEDRFLIPRIDAEPELHRFVQSTSGFDAFKSGRR